MLHLQPAARKAQLVFTATLALALSACAEPSAPLELGTLSAPVVCDDGFLHFDDVYSGIIQDVIAQPAGARPFLRYIGLPNRFVAGACAAEQETERRALRKLVNSLSLTTSIVLPPSIGTIAGTGIIYRIDLRAFGWNRTVSVPGVGGFSDVWQALVAANPYAVEFQGDDVEGIRDMTGTNVPFMFSDSLLDVATDANLYYALLRVPPTRNAFLQGLGISRPGNLAARRIARAGTGSSAITDLERLAERHAMRARPGRVWLAMNFDVQAPSMFFNPLSLPEQETFAIYSLPNGLHGYATFTEQGARVADSELLFDNADPSNTVRTPVSCMRCHAQGFVRIADQVRAFALANAGALDLDPFEQQLVKEIYPLPATLGAVLNADSAPYRTALQQSGVPPTGPDPIAAVFDRYQDVTLEAAAGDLLIDAEFLAHELPRLDPALQALATGTLRRSRWNELYVKTLCTLSVAEENHPTDAACSAAGL